MSKIITCEQVSNGHPDKICDQIADAIVTDILQHDRNARVAIECLLKKSQLFIAGEVTTDYRPNYNQIVHDVIDFPENNISIESFYDRLRPCYDSIMQFGDRVLVAQMNWNGMLEGAVYGFVEDPEEGWSPIECRLELLKISDETYTDAGHAIEWCIKNAH